MTEKYVANSRYIYTHETGESLPQTADIHHVARKNGIWQSVVCFSAISIPLFAFFLLQGNDISASTLLLYLSIGAFFIKLMRRNLIEKESVLIIPAFGVQLETHYKSGRAVRCFVPIDDILKPVINECVTPVTCYWSLALILRAEEELTLVFKASRLPLKMLLPVWEALCAATETGESKDNTPCSM